MAKINYILSKKFQENQAEIFIDFQPVRLTHYRVKTGIFISQINFDRLTATDKLLSYDRLYDIEQALLKALPKTRQEAEQIIKRVKGEDDNILTVFSDYKRDRIIERGLADGTIEIYKCVERMFECYDKHTSIKKVNQKWLAGLIQYMCNNNIGNRTQQTYFRVIKTFLKDCVEKDLCDSKVLEYKPSFKTVETDVVYLTPDELHDMYVVELPTKIQRSVRDVFIVQSLTGLRYSDMLNIKKDNIQEDESGEYITLITKKTLKRLKIYFNDRCKHILTQYDYTLPHPQVAMMNKYLPLIAKQAGVKGKIEVVKIVGTKRVVEIKDKWELIKTHTARRTFISLMLELGESITTIRSITGHSQLSSFSRYVGVSDEKKSSAVRGLDW
jgi:site-specific recombinase XerD